MLRAGEIAALTGGILHGNAETAIGEIAIDSRTYHTEKSLFVALRGPNFDGHDFVRQALRKGATTLLVERTESTWEGYQALIVVPDTQRALQALAGHWRRRFSLPVVAITGSHGKTTVKDMLASIVAREKTLHRSPGSYNSQVGVSLSLLGLRSEHEIALIEAGISRTGEMERLEEMIAPTCGILTGIGHAHTAGLGDLATTAREKKRLFENLGQGWLVVPADDPHVGFDQLACRPTTFAIAGTDGTISSADIQIVDIEETEVGYRFRAVVFGEKTDILGVHLLGRYHLKAAAAALAAAARLGLGTDSMRLGLASFHLGPRRMEMHTTARGTTLLNDAYNSDPTSARAALSALAHYGAGRPTIAVLGDMLDLGSESAVRHRELGAMVAGLGVDRLIGVGDYAHEIVEAARNAGMAVKKSVGVKTMDDLKEAIDPWISPESVILFKASRAMGLDRVAEEFLESVAPNRLLIDLDRICENVQAIRHQVAPAKIIAVVKGFAYGGDALRISQTLVQQGVDALAVAYPDEAVALRNAGLELEILVTNTLLSEADKIVAYNLTALVYSETVVEALQEQAVKQNRRVQVHIEIDTGMQRLGIRPENAAGFLQVLSQYDRVDVSGVMTHFVAADSPLEDAFTLDQNETFSQVVSLFSDEGFHPKWIHTSNTAALWRFHPPPSNAVRVGLGLYGYAPSSAVNDIASSAGIRRALSWTTQIIDIRPIHTGETVGYNRTWAAPGPSVIATIAVGYHDGFPRFMSNGGEVLIRGQRAPVVGTVCMDVTMVDITNIGSVEVGDEVVLFGKDGGEEITVDDIARRGDTINYEILCRISARVRRIFVRGD